VEGRVQGVGFRAWTLRRAHELQLRGTVSNLADGSVDVEAEGPPEAVSRMRALLGQGPVPAHVTHVRDVAPRHGVLPYPFDVAF